MILRSSEIALTQAFFMYNVLITAGARPLYRKSVQKRQKAAKGDKKSIKRRISEIWEPCSK